MRKISVMLIAFMLSLVVVTAQTHSITGIVTDSKGDPVQGASINIKGSNVGTAADKSGSFVIKAKSGDQLIITAINFGVAFIKVNNQTTINVSLKAQENKMDEVVVTALGRTRSRNTLPYAAQQISGAEVNKTVSTNFVNNLSGKVAGLQISAENTMGGSTNVILRGFKSLTGSNQALFVVDGVPFDNTNNGSGKGPGASFDLGNGAADINPDNIESVSVLKGAAASALYGSRASNGVILITTKKGRKGRGVDIGLSFGISTGKLDKSTLPIYQTQYGQGYGSSGTDPGNPNLPGFFYYQPIPGSTGSVKIVQTNNDAGTGPEYNPNISVYNWDAFAPGDPNFGKATPWQIAQNHNASDFFVNPLTTTTNITVQSGGDNGTFAMAYTRDDSKDFMPNSSLKKNLINLTATHNITDKLTIGGSFNYSDNNAVGRYLFPYGGTTSVMTDFRQWWPTNVNIKQLKSDYFNTLTNNTWNWQSSAYNTNAIGQLGKPAYHDNPYWDRYQNFEADSRDRFFGNANANYKISNHFNLMARVSKDYYTQIVETRNNVGSQTVSYYNRFNQTYAETNFDGLLTYDQNLSKNISLKALIGSNIRKVRNQSVESGTSGGLVVPGLYSLSNSLKTPNAASEVDQRKEVDGIFAGATVGFKDIITLDGTFRRDKSSTLPSNNNAFNYYSGSANFLFSKLLPNVNWLTYSKVWGNYASVGGDAPFYSLQNTYTANTPFNGNTVFATPTTNNNPNLKPERNNTYEFGLEASFLKSRIGFSVDYYHSQQIDQIMPASVSAASGYGTFYVNGGAVQNQGVEASLNITPIKNNKFSWTVIANWSTNKSKVLSLYNGQSAYIIAKLQNSIQLVAEATGNNRAYGVLRGTDYIYNNGQRVIDATGHYEINANPLTDIGNVNAKWIGGLNNSVTYKNISLSFLIDVKQGGSVYSLDMDYGSSSGLYPRTAGYNDLGNAVRSPLTGNNKSGGIILKGVTENGKANTVRIDESDINNSNYSFSSAYGEADKEFVYDASYVKLREVAITYSVPVHNFTKLTFFKGLDISLSGRNLWIIHKNLPYADPEQGQASGNASIGFQNGAYPTVRTVAATVKFRF